VILDRCLFFNTSKKLDNVIQELLDDNYINNEEDDEEDLLGF